MKIAELQIRPGAQFHVGRVAADPEIALNESSDWIHSDTLFSALINIAAKVFPSETDTIAGHFRNGDIRFSSIFYFMEEEGRPRIYFLPKPLHYNLLVKYDFKQWAGVQFISKSIWEQGILPEKWEQRCTAYQGSFLVLKTEISGRALKYDNEIRIFNSPTLPKVAVHKQREEDSFYYTSNFQIPDNSSFVPGLKIGMYFLLDVKASFEADPIYKKIMSLLALLPDEGLGGERSTGCGRFDGLNLLTYDWLLPESNARVAISLVSPSKGDFGKMKQYRTVLRGGRSDRRIPRPLKVVRMLTEGSIFESEPEGDIADISPSKKHGKFFRYGKALTLPAHPDSLTYEPTKDK